MRDRVTPLGPPIQSTHSGCSTCSLFTEKVAVVGGYNCWVFAAQHTRKLDQRRMKESAEPRFMKEERGFFPPLALLSVPLTANLVIKTDSLPFSEMTAGLGWPQKEPNDYHQSHWKTRDIVAPCTVVPIIMETHRAKINSQSKVFVHRWRKHLVLLQKSLMKQTR